jgi:hypothetical protein
MEMRKRVIEINDVSPFLFDDPFREYRTDCGQRYLLGLNLRPEQIENVRGGIGKSGGETYIHVKDSG